jgi:hypothetical protein
VRVKRETVALDAAKLSEYVGVYELNPGFDLRIYRDGEALMAQATGQGAVQIFPEALDRFFFKIVDAQLSFRRGQDGKVVSVILHQGGRDIPGPRKP